MIHVRPLPQQFPISYSLIGEHFALLDSAYTSVVSHPAVPLECPTRGVPLSRSVASLQPTLMTNNVDRAPPWSPVDNKRFPCASSRPWLPYSASPDPLGTGARRTDTCTHPRLAVIAPRFPSSGQLSKNLDTVATSAAPPKSRPTPAKSSDTPLQKKKKKKITFQI